MGTAQVFLGFHNMFAGGTVLDRALAAVMLCRSFFSRYHPSASGSFRHFVIPLSLNFYQAYQRPLS